MHNIVLIGMPGSGKSTVARYIAKRNAMPLVDTDEMIVDLTKKSIEDIFEEEGEERFREYESICAKEAARLKKSVIATGGGIILKEENMFALKENGIIFFLDRPVEAILQSSQLADRPLVKSSKEKLIELYNARIELYKKYADHILVNTISFERICGKIVEIYRKNR